ncbi:MAG: AzlD domain-containing protein [Actinomycetaceae bacterium]|nr:AzlD domain-containing protein [Actinomycetaceae bacterium]
MTPELGYLLAILAIVFVIDFALRALPFALLQPLRESRFIRDMGQWMPAGILLILAVVTFHSQMESTGGRWWAPILAAGITIGVHLWSGRKMLLSILIGTCSYIALLNIAL